MEQQLQLLRGRKETLESRRGQLQGIQARLLARITSRPKPSEVHVERCQTLCQSTPGIPAPLAKPAATAKKLDLPIPSSSPVATCKPTPQPAVHKALTRQVLTSADLYVTPDLLPPHISSFRCCAGIGYKDLLEASGSMSGTIDFTQLGFLDVLESARHAAAQRLCCGQAQICWFVQSHYEVAPGMPLSFSASLSSPECVASVILHCMLGQLEVSILGLRDNPACARIFGNPHPQAVHPGLRTRACMGRSTGSDPSRRKRARCAAQREDVGTGVSMHEYHSCGDGDDEHEDLHAEWDGFKIGCGGGAYSGGEGALLGVHSGDARSELDSTTPRGMRLRCGVNETCDAAVAIRTVVERVAETVRLCSAVDAEAAWGLLRACGDRCGEIVAMFQASSGGAAGGVAAAGIDEVLPPPHIGGGGAEGSDGEDSVGAANSGVVDGCSELLGHVERGEGLGAPQGSLSDMHVAGSGISDATGLDSEGRHTDGEMEGHGGGGVNCGAGACCTCDVDGRTCGCHDAACRGADPSDEERVAAYHSAVTSVVLGVLRAVRDTCYEVCEMRLGGRQEVCASRCVLCALCCVLWDGRHGWHTRGALQGVPVAGGEGEPEAMPSEADRSERSFVALTMLCAAHTISLRDAGRVTRSMAFNSILPGMLQCEVRPPSQLP